MPGFRTRFDDLPAEFAVFPLEGVLLLPRGKLPLNIFEPRYLAMTEDSFATGRMFAMVQPDPALPETSHGPAIYRTGCLGRLTSFSETDDGRMLITLTGLARFTIASEIDMRRGYRRVVGDFSRYRADMDEPADIAIDRAGLIDALRGYFTRRSIEPNWDAINRLPDDALVVTLAMVCPFEAIEKQALLEAPDEAERAGTLLALLRMGAAEPGGPGGGSSGHSGDNDADEHRRRLS
jgi:Lon protease-like protein